MSQTLNTSAQPWMEKLGEVILASGSPRRKELLQNVGLPFVVEVSGCDETPIVGESAIQMVERLALVKAEAVAKIRRTAIVLGADTTVCIDGETLGKPDNQEHAISMISQIQGRTHEVLGGVAILSAARNIQVVRSFRTEVTMRPMSIEEIRWYVTTGEPMDKAGSYAIQGIGLQYVESIRGSYTNVVGLDIAQVMGMLKEISEKAISQ
jgi:septum formation protein